MHKILINGKTLLESVNNSKKIDCSTIWNECPYFFEGECHNKNVENLDEIVLCPYYIVRKKDK